LCLISHSDCCLWSFPALLFSSLVTATIFFAFYFILFVVPLHVSRAVKWAGPAQPGPIGPRHILDLSGSVH
jgi:hypothetical protein